MAIKKKPRIGRPPGREYTHIVRVPMRPETWAALCDVANEDDKGVAELIRELVDRYLKRRLMH